ncbi:MAG: ABC transporter ATP-binding protein/permease [Bacillota bacterium]|nr:ABC transporter ATP-binding protein/permease [Bacillota bacterium]
MAKNTVKADENLKSKSKTEILVRLLRYLKPFKKQTAFVIMLLIFVMVCSLLNPYLLKIAIDKFIKSKNLKGLLILGSGLLALNLSAMFMSKLRIKLMAKITSKILLNIRQELYIHIQKLSFNFFDSRPVGKILARVMGDVNSLQELFNNSITSFIPEILTLVCVTALMFLMNYRLAAVSILILPFLFLSMFYVETKSRKRWQNYRKKRSNFNAYTHEDFSGIKVIKAFAVEERTSVTFSKLTHDMMESFIDAVKLNDLFWPLVEFSWGIGSILVYWYSIKLLDVGDITVGTIIAFTMYIGMFWRPIINLADFYNTLVTNFSSAERIFEILDIKPDIEDITYALKMPEINGDVEFKNVSFAYDNSYVLNDVSFKVNKGEKIALVGETGAGKTTIVNLISRFYDVQQGEVLIDGINVKDVEIESLRSQMGIMLQDTFLFSTTIMENIRYGNLNATDEEIIEAAKAVNAHEFIMKLEKGYDTEVNERGSRLSVGQRQLISFARALLANPRILILDEATSNIDTQTERLVQEGIRKLLEGRTSFVVAHRLSTIRDCDKIMVVDNGEISESGNHGQLMKKKGIYYKLYTSQYKFLQEGA